MSYNIRSQSLQSCATVPLKSILPHYASRKMYTRRLYMYVQCWSEFSKHRRRRSRFICMCTHVLSDASKKLMHLSCVYAFVIHYNKFALCGIVVQNKEISTSPRSKQFAYMYIHVLYMYNVTYTLYSPN